MTKILRAHDPAWKAAFEGEAEALRLRFRPVALQIHHIGSTAVPNIYAKPVIDILVESGDLSFIDARAALMMAVGYDVRGEYGIAGRRYFSMRASGATKTGFHVHVFEQGSFHIDRHLAFRDYLLEKPEVAEAYSRLKRMLADDSGVLPADYAARKERFVSEIEMAALAHFGLGG